MGSFFSKPSLPSPVVYTYAPSPTPIVSAPPATTADGVSPDAERVKTAIQRKRALPQTIQTSFRGVLEQADFVPARKNLLGE
jgi:hypothetical protein